MTVPIPPKRCAPRMRISESVKLEDEMSEVAARRIFSELLSRCQLRHNQSDGADRAVSETVVFNLT
jgi:hypothetical protein